MRIARKFTAGFFFILFFLLFLIVGMVKLEFLNSKFLFSSLQRNQIYTRLPMELSKAFPNTPSLPEEEKVAYSEIVSSISPASVQKILEENLLSVLNFLNGKSKDINIFISASALKIPGMADIRWSLSKNLPKETSGMFQIVYGIGNKLLLIWVALIAELILLFFVAGRRILLITGILALLLGGIGKLFLLVISATLPAKAEPAQVLLKLLSSSVLSDIAISWIILGTIFILIWIFLKKQNRFS